MSTAGILAFAFGTLFVSILLGIAIFIMVRNKPVQPEAMLIFRVVLALAAGGIGAVLPGLINLHIGSTSEFGLRAGGALALTALIYLVNPPNQVARGFTPLGKSVVEPSIKLERRRRQQIPPSPDTGGDKGGGA